MLSIDTRWTPSHTEISQPSSSSAAISSIKHNHSPESPLPSSPLADDTHTHRGPVSSPLFTARTSRTSSIQLGNDEADLSWDGVNDSEINEDDSMFRGEDTIDWGRRGMVGSGQSESDGDGKQTQIQTTPVTYAALSKKADLIIANAKKKLNLLEGHLKGARHSLLATTPTLAELREFQNLANTEDLPLTKSLEDEDLHLSRASHVNSAVPRVFRSLQSLRKAKYSHSRIYSEPTVPTKSDIAKGSPLQRPSLDLRWGANLGTVTKDEVHLNQLAQTTDQKYTPIDSPIDSPQSIATTQKLRSQADELRNRISFIQLHAHDDALQSRSLRGSDPVAEADDFAMLSQIQALEQSLRLEDEVTEQLENVTQFSKHKDTREEKHRNFGHKGHQMVDSDIDDEGSDHDEEIDYETDSEAFERGDDASLSEEPHENRADAFDYEHFILHSGMGNHRADRRSSSGSSTSSTPTTRGIHQRDPTDEHSYAANSDYSTGHYTGNDSINSFASAAEISEFDADSETSDDQQGNLLHDDMDHAWPVPPSRSASALSGSEFLRPMSNIFPSSNGFQHSITQRPASAVLTALLTRESPTSPTVPLTKGDEDLLYALADTLRTVCLRLQRSNVDQADMTLWRERLEEARKVLSGEM